MNSYVDPKADKTNAQETGTMQKQAKTQEVQHADNRPEAAAHAVLQNKIDNSRAAMQFAQINPRAAEGGVTQLAGGKKGEEDDGKKKGDDYCNNIGKLISGMEISLPGFLNEAIREQIVIINNNRSNCSVSSNLVTGPDTNTGEYGTFAVNVNNVITALGYLLQDSDRAYVQKGVRGHIPTLVGLLNRIPDVCVDLRVAAVINAGTEGDTAALNAINAALRALVAAIKARFPIYLDSIVNPPKKKDEEEDKGGGGTGAEVGGGIGGGGTMIETH